MNALRRWSRKGCLRGLRDPSNNSRKHRCNVVTTGNCYHDQIKKLAERMLHPTLHRRQAQEGCSVEVPQRYPPGAILVETCGVSDATTSVPTVPLLKRHVPTPS